MLMLIILILTLALCVVLKSFSQSNNNFPLIRLQGYVTNSNNIKDETVLYFDSNATMTFNPRTDAYKLMNSDVSVPNIYTIKDSTALSIDALPQLTNNLVIPVGYNVLNDGQYTIEAYEITNFDPSVSIVLEDLVMDSSQVLNQNNIYNFSIHTGDKGGRFYLKFSIATTTGINNLAKSDNYKVYSYDNNIHLTYSNEKNNPAIFDVYNINGQKIMEQNIQNGNYTFNLNSNPGCYITKLIDKSGVYTNKMFIK